MGVPVVEAVVYFDLTTNASGTGNVDITSLGLQENDILLVFCAVDGTTSIFNTSGNNTGAFTDFGFTQGAGGEEWGVGWGREGVTVDTTGACSWGAGSQQGRFAFVRVSGCIESGSPLQGPTTASDNTTSTTNTINAITTSFANMLALAMVSVDRDRVDAADGLATANGWSEFGTSGSSGGANGAGMITAEKAMPAAESSLACTFGTWATDGNVARAFALRGTPDEIAPLIINAGVEI